jgi:divalent metal cation (Fe/Co/Zn/Cd) transporter
MVNRVREIVLATEEVIDVGPVLMRKSGDVIFADVTISLRADASFDRAHEISSKVEKNIKEFISNSEITVHFEPTWKDVPRDTKIHEIAAGVFGVRGVHNVNHHSTDGVSYVSLHVMVDRHMNLEEAHKISEMIEERIRQSLPEIEHITIHLEPHISIPKEQKTGQTVADEKIFQILKSHKEVKKIGDIVTLNFGEIVKIDINCSFDKELSIEKVHDLTSQIEHDIRGQFTNSIITIHPEPA